MRQLVILISIITVLLFTMNAKSQSLCSNDTIEKSWQNGKLTLESHHCDSGYYFRLKFEDKTIYHSGFGDGFLGKIWWLKIPDGSFAIVMSDFYCDGNSYSILTIDSINNCKTYFLFDSYAGDECEDKATDELIIKDENNDGYQELYFLYRQEKTQLIEFPCSKKIELKNLLK